MLTWLAEGLTLKLTVRGLRVCMYLIRNWDQMQEGVILMCAWGSDSKLGSQMLGGCIQSGTGGLDAGGRSCSCGVTCRMSHVSQNLSQRSLFKGGMEDSQ